MNCDRSAITPARIPLKASIGRPAGFWAVFNISGVTAPTSTTFATREVPWRPMYRATSPAPVEWATWTASCRSSSSTSAARSEEHTSELQSPDHLVCRLLLEKKNETYTADLAAIGRAHVY